MLPSEVRRTILDQHAALRALLEELERGAGSLDAGDHRVLPRLLDDAARLCQEFERHLRFEERELAPILAAIDSWGPIRVSRLESDHVSQRALLGDLLACLADVENSGARSAFVVLLRHVTAILVLDMAIEERDAMTASLLRDDIIIVDQRTS